MSSYVPPPPIAASAVALPMRTTTSPARSPEARLVLHQREAQLQSDLQHLLDAQADGLITGLGGAPEDLPDDLLSNGSSTPTASTSFRTGSRGNGMTAAEARQPKPKRVGLGGARRGLWKTIRKLATVKQEEVALINSDIEHDEAISVKLDAWQQKWDGLQNSVQNIEQDSEEGARAKSLRHEAEGLGVEIQELEARLAEMKSRHWVMLQEVSRLENSVQARLSSYRESLGIVEKEIRGFLHRPPTGDGEEVTGNTHRKGKDRVHNFMALPPQRRTLEMARSHWEDRRQSLERMREGIEFEKEALEEGAVVWKDVVDEVLEFESKLRAQMQRTAPTEQTPDEEEKQNDLKLLLKDMDQTVVQIESKLKLAEARDWKLLVCCIGAELEALRQGKEILEALLDQETQLEAHSPDEPRTQGSIHELNGGLLGQDPAVMTSSRESVLHRNKVKDKAYDTEDEEPDPELLISHQDTDTSE
ncbi:hypothetical protein EV356DRAFT_472267 [Viridothelium virens]|uniref:Autophagy-related protein 28 n=1 Tax=Viridothelium virens TaxID=1048519 RepID=A0A6A6GZC6_VIRVR|nr:hypothetical protein EV356DRAFT_472267 [Viridothelium virens]